MATQPGPAIPGINETLCWRPGLLEGSGHSFDEAICDFAGDHADQAERDYEAFAKAIREGRVEAVAES